MAGAECCSNPPTLNPAFGGGHVTELAGLSSYANGPIESKHAILFLTDVFGYENPTLRKLADKVAAEGFHVVIPDLIHGDPYVPGRSQIQEWVKNHGPDRAAEETKPLVEHLKGQGITAIGAVGFCWGAKVLVHVAKFEGVRAGVLCHPSMVTVDDIKEISVPLCVLGAEIDHTSPPELLGQFKEILDAKVGLDSHVKIFPKVSHGFTVRYEIDDVEAAKVAEEAHADMLNWFHNHVK